MMRFLPARRYTQTIKHPIKKQHCIFKMLIMIEGGGEGDIWTTYVIMYLTSISIKFGFTNLNMMTFLDQIKPSGPNKYICFPEQVVQS